MSVVQHLEWCRTSHTRQALRSLLQPHHTDKTLEDLGKSTQYRTHIYQDATKQMHLRVRDSSAQVSLLRSFVRDLKKGHCPYIAEEHAEQFPMYMQLEVSGEADLHGVCRTVHDMILRRGCHRVQCYCFAAESSTTDDRKKQWVSRFVRIHWPLLLVSSQSAMHLRECALHTAKAVHGKDAVRHVNGWETQYNLPLSMIGCGGHLSICGECRNLSARRASCDSCCGMGLKVVEQALYPISVLKPNGTPHWQDQRKIGVVGMYGWDLSGSETAVHEVLEYLSVRALLPACRYHRASLVPCFWSPPLPPLCTQCSEAVPLNSAGVCVLCRKNPPRKNDPYRKYRRTSLDMESPQARALCNMVMESALDPYLYLLASEHQRSPDHSAEASLAGAGLGFCENSPAQREREASVRSFIQSHRRKYRGDAPSAAAAACGKAEKLLQIIREKPKGVKEWFAHTRITDIWAMQRRSGGDGVDLYVVCLGGICGSFCPQQRISHDEASVVEVVRDEGCRYRCNPPCTAVYPFVKTTLFLRHQRMLFGTRGMSLQGSSCFPVSKRQWSRPDQRVAAIDRLVSAFDRAPPPKRRCAADR